MMDNLVAADNPTFTTLTKGEITETLATLRKYELEYRNRDFIIIADAYAEDIARYETKLKWLNEHART